MKFKGLLEVLVAGLICLPFMSYGEEGRRVAPPVQEDIPALREKAEQGDALAEYNLGNAYSKGEGVQKDSMEAVKWWKRAAMQSHAGAQYNLSLAYAEGTGVSKDYEEAYAWATVAAGKDQGRTKATELIFRLFKDMTSGQVVGGTRLSKEYAETIRTHGLDQSSTNSGCGSGSQNDSTQKAFEKVDLQITEKKLSKKECEASSDAPKTGTVLFDIGNGGKDINIYNDYNGRTYSLKFINRGSEDIKKLNVQCRFYYKTTKSWRVKVAKEKIIEEHFDYAFSIPKLSPEAEYTAVTIPFVLVSSYPPSGYYRTNGDAEVVDSRPRGLWVRIFLPTAGTYIDFCEPPDLSSKVTW